MKYSVFHPTFSPLKMSCPFYRLCHHWQERTQQCYWHKGSFTISKVVKLPSQKKYLNGWTFLNRLTPSKIPVWVRYCYLPCLVQTFMKSASPHRARKKLSKKCVVQLKNVVPWLEYARLEYFRALKFSKLESFRALKFSILEIEPQSYPDLAYEPLDDK